MRLTGSTLLLALALLGACSDDTPPQPKPGAMERFVAEQDRNESVKQEHGKAAAEARGRDQADESMARQEQFERNAH
ncbi:hypothetical protein [Allosphingosinicella deserti]|uniref:Lipoprotein n=1 Tax=Allosphingosinicella deserti TaxID=2116704 RepID=A0A2P7QKE0_9SPHN|nr:hypothetical protein [Sphingomonas deserti]PSJ38445.1 hypothetical protein C7I55_18580 [Sphingomonas deserti]